MLGLDSVESIQKKDLMVAKGCQWLPSEAHVGFLVYCDLQRWIQSRYTVFFRESTLTLIIAMDLSWGLHQVSMFHTNHIVNFSLLFCKYFNLVSEQAYSFISLPIGAYYYLGCLDNLSSLQVCSIEIIWFAWQIWSRYKIRWQNQRNIYLSQTQKLVSVWLSKQCCFHLYLVHLLQIMIQLLLTDTERRRMPIEFQLQLVVIGYCCSNAQCLRSRR